MMATVTYETVFEQARQLTLAEQRRLREDLAALEVQPRPAPRESLYGIAAHLGPAPSAEEIDEARREMWANFPRDDI